jgi:hypothetical protein
LEPFVPHTNLSDEVNRAIVEGELRGGVNLSDLRVGRKLFIYFRVGYYLLDHREDGFYMSEHLFNGKFGFWAGSVPCVVTGSLFHRHGTMLKMKWVGRGMFLEFHLNDGPRLTSAEVLEVEEVW